MATETSAPQPMTVVIPTLGGDSLRGTIEALNRGSIVPAEILICIPIAEAPRVQNISPPNARVIVTDCRGQVAQRAIGFQNAAHDFVMQIDDDILVEKACVECLLTALKKAGGKAAVGPSLMSTSTGASVYRQPARNAALLKIYYWIMNGAAGYQPGKIDKSGSFVGVDPGTATDKLFDVESLAGGCIMHHRKNLMLENFYPFEGKAYYEDMVHSHHIRSRGISLYVHAGARCWLESIPSTIYGHADYLKFLATDYRHRKYCMRLDSRKSLRIYLFYLVRYLSYLGKKLIELMMASNRGARTTGK